MKTLIFILTLTIFKTNLIEFSLSQDLQNPFYVHNYFQPVSRGGQYNYEDQDTTESRLRASTNYNFTSQNLITLIVPEESEEWESSNENSDLDPETELYLIVEKMMKNQNEAIPLARIMSLSEKVTNQAQSISNNRGYGQGGKFTVKQRHPCFRPCSSDPARSMTCGYNFTVANYLTLSPHCFDCPNVTRDCFELGCLPANGLQMPVAVVNKLMPGPPIRVCEGDRVVVDVHNKLSGQETAIHWHGIHQRGTPHMDGVPFLTQCPIMQGSTFRYDFEVPKAGTYFWHSHSGVQRADGVFGPLIVRKDPAMDPQARLYDLDLPEHELLIWDLFSDLALSSNLRGHIRDQRELPQNILINGKGLPRGFFDDFQYYDTIQDKGKPFVPLHEIRIRQGYSYRIRVISNGVTLCPVELSIENHRNLQVIASDGFDLRPVIVESIILHAGERWDFVLRGNQPIGSYWIKVRGLLDCETQNIFQLAILNYEGIKPGTLPQRSIKRYLDSGPTTFNSGLQLNPVNIAPGVPGRSITVSEISSLYDDDPQIIQQDRADYQFYLSFDFKPISNVNFGQPNPIKDNSNLFRQRRRENVVHFLPQFNYITHVQPVSPPLTQPETISQMNICNQESKRAQGIDCSKKHCKCTHLIKVTLNSIVEFVLVDRGFRFDAAHPFHLHGHLFRVVSIEKLGNNTDAGIIKQMDRQGLIRRRRFNAPIKDTVYVPDGGYTILRFRADNPGFWFFHCHVEFHQERGMSLVLQVGEPSEMPRPPLNFPKCQNYVPPVNREIKTL